MRAKTQALPVLFRALRDHWAPGPSLNLSRYFPPCHSAPAKLASPGDPRMRKYVPQGLCTCPSLSSALDPLPNNHVVYSLTSFVTLLKLLKRHFLECHLP